MDKQTEQTLKRIASEIGYLSEEINFKLTAESPVSMQGMVNIADTLARLSAVAFIAAGRLPD